MASSFKELNNIYIKRPAVTLFRKPFANNDEMSDILEGMLDIYASVEQESISKYKGPKYKAIYWNHLTGNPLFERYGEVVVFSEDANFYAGGEAVRSSNDLFKKLNQELSVLGFKISNNNNNIDIVSSQQVEGWLQSAEGKFFARLNEADNIRDRYSKEARTFDLWVIDPKLQVILDNVSVKSTYTLNVSTSILPYLDFFESIRRVGSSKFETSTEGKKVLKDLKSAGVTEYKTYQITLREHIKWEKKTSKQVDILSNYFFSDLGDYLNWRSICDLHSEFLSDSHKNELNTLIKNDPYFNDYLIDSTKHQVEGMYVPGGTLYLRIPINNMWFGVGKSFKVYLKNIKNKLFSTNLENDLFPGSLVFSSCPNKVFSYSTQKYHKNIRITYVIENTGRFLYITDIADVRGIDLIKIYTLLCFLSSASEIQKLKKQQGQDIYSFGYDSPLRVTNSKDMAGISVVETMSDADFTEDPISLTASLMKVARIRASVKVQVETKTKLKKNLTHGAIPNVLDFKLEYYAKIYERYIKPRYEKYTEFIKSGLMKVYPFDIIDYGNTLQKIIYPEVSQDPHAGNISYSPQEKLELINYFESVLFNNYSGFYTTSTTPLSETISPYANTYIDKVNISSEDNDQAALMLSAISALGSKGDIFTEVNNVSNKDVSSIALSRQTRGKSSASVVIKNLDSKYCFSSGKYAGDIIFEPMDEIFIYLPTFDEKLVLSFKGFVDSAQYINDKGYHSIGIQASCPMKKLELVRTNVRPSLSSAENSNTAVHPFTVPKELYESIDRWGPFMFMQALTFYSSMLKQSTIEDANTYIYTVDPNTKLPTFDDTLLQFLWYRQTNAQNTQEQAATALSQLVSKYTATERFLNNQPLTQVQFFGDLSTPYTNITASSGVENVNPSTSTIVSSRGANELLITTYSNASIKNEDTNFKVTYNIYSQRTDGYTPVSKNLVAQLLGTLQPAWVIGSQDVNIVFSDYRTNLDILSETADKFNCYLYSDKNGVVQFRPPQISLMNLSCSTYDNQGTLSTDRILKNNDFRFEVRPDIINEQTTTTYHTQCDDSALVTWLQLSGQNVWGSLNADTGNAVVIQDIPKSLKYGIKTQQEQILSGIEKKEALYIYGLSLLDRQNSLFRSGNIAGLASGDMDVNISVYSPVDNTVFLADGLTINYTAGGSLTYNIPLKWGRKPLFEVPLKTTSSTYSAPSYTTPQLYDGYIFSPSKKLEEQVEKSAWLAARTAVSQFKDKIDFVKLRDLLLKSVKNHEISNAYYNQIISYLDYVEEYPNNDYILSSFIFNGYVWDGVSSISFEDLILTYFGSLLSQDSGFEIAFGINGRGLSRAQAEAIINKANKGPQKVLELHGGEVLNVVIPNGSNREKQIRIYVNQNSKH